MTAATAIKFDLTRDQPDNVIHNPDGSVRFRLGSLRRNNNGGGIVELFGDLKRHVMGPRLAEPVNEIAGDDVTPIPPNPRNRHTPDTFLTENLWGVGSTAPYMHDGRSTTLVEAILEHGNGRNDDTSEARRPRANYLNRSQRGQTGADRVPRQSGPLQGRGGGGRRRGLRVESVRSDGALRAAAGREDRAEGLQDRGSVR